jgi:glucose-1-phosphate cytidylyltransferase
MDKLARDGELMIYHHNGFWHCMDTYRDFVALNEMWKHNPPWRVWTD